MATGRNMHERYTLSGEIASLVKGYTPNPTENIKYLAVTKPGHICPAIEWPITIVILWSWKAALTNARSFSAKPRISSVFLKNDGKCNLTGMDEANHKEMLQLMEQHRKLIN